MTDVAQIVAGLTPGARRALLAMSSDWQFCGKATFDANGAWAASIKTRSAVERRIMTDGKWSRYGYRLNPLGLAVRTALLSKEGESADA